MLNKTSVQSVFAKIPTIDRVHWETPFAVETLATAIFNYLKSVPKSSSGEIVLVCIGTDRSTGDALGPVIGSQLIDTIPGLYVYGTLDDPVHAANLAEKLGEIGESHRETPMVAIDACLGKAENVGYITTKFGPLHPGTGVNKSLPCVGDIHVIGTVNVGGFMEYLVLQNTRLSLVMNMARVIAAALSLAVKNHLGLSEASAAEQT